MKLGFDMSIVSATSIIQAIQMLWAEAWQLTKKVFKYVQKATKITGLRLSLMMHILL